MGRDETSRQTLPQQFREITMLATRRIIAGLAGVAMAACAQNDAPLAPRFATANIQPEFLEVCHRLEDGYQKLSLPQIAWPRHEIHGDALAGGPKLDTNCEKYLPRILRDEFDGPLGPNWGFYRASSTVQNGTLVISGATGYFNFRSLFYAPFPVSKIAWELGWNTTGTSGRLIRSASGCGILCSYDASEMFGPFEFLVSYGWDHRSPWTSVGKPLTPGEHAVRVEWNRVLGRATYWVDGEQLTSFPTITRFTYDYGGLDFQIVGSVTLTYLQYEIYPE